MSLGEREDELLDTLEAVISCGSRAAYWAVRRS
jgi:hypothetical protein